MRADGAKIPEKEHNRQRKMKQPTSTEKYRQFITVKFAASRPMDGGRLVTAVKTTSNRDSSSMIYHG